jgi:hypothetical protein
LGFAILSLPKCAFTAFNFSGENTMQNLTGR